MIETKEKWKEGKRKRKVEGRRTLQGDFEKHVREAAGREEAEQVRARPSLGLPSGSWGTARRKQVRERTHRTRSQAALQICHCTDLAFTVSEMESHGKPWKAIWANEEKELTGICRITPTARWDWRRQGQKQEVSSVIHECNHSFIHKSNPSVNKNVFCANCVPSNVLGSWGTSVNTADKSTCPYGI